MLVKKDPAILFPIAIAIEVVLLFGVGAHVSGKLSGLILLAMIAGQLLFLTTWGGLVLQHVKNIFFRCFWIPLIVLLLVFNVFIAFQLGPDFMISAEQFLPTTNG